MSRDRSPADLERVDRGERRAVENPELHCTAISATGVACLRPGCNPLFEAAACVDTRDGHEEAE